MQTQLARYRKIATLGSGGMATVVLAEDTVLGRQVALKRIHGAADPQAVSRLRREALLGASFSHPNIVAVYDVVATDEGDVVIVMEYVQGETLRDGLERGGRLTAASALSVIDGVAAGLDAIHSRGIVHRDVKPANILLGADGAVKLADLGIASVPDRTRITSAGTVLGSFGYMAPEQLEDGPVTPAIDIYALAAVAYEALGGVKAHPEPNPLAVAHAIASRPPPDLRDAWPAAPAAAAALLQRSMARDPAQRPRTAGELARGLHRTFAPGAAPAATQLRPGPTVAPPRLDPDRSRAWMVPAVLVAVIALAIALVLVLGSPGNSGSSKNSGSSRSSAGPGGSAPAVGHKATRSHARSTGHAAPPPHKPAKTTSSAQSPTTAQSTSTATASTPTTSSAPPAGATPPPGSGTPTGAVSSFYNLAASHQFPQAWALADGALRQQLGGYQSFQATMAPVRKIIFRSDQVINQSASAATVAIRTTSVRDGGAQQCGGTVELVPAGGSGGWLMHGISINCG